MNTKQYTLDDILNFKQRFRATFINSLNGFKTPVLIGTIDKNGLSNLAIFNSLIHIGAHPPLVGFIVRPDSVERHTLQNILETGVFTINHVTEAFYKQAHQTAARYLKTESEFSKVGLTEDYHQNCIAPFVKESNTKIEVEFTQKTDITVNEPFMIIGKIKTVILPNDCLMDDGFVDLEKAKTIACLGLDSYYNISPIARLSYAKPDKEITEIKSKLLE